MPELAAPRAPPDYSASLNSSIAPESFTRRCVKLKGRENEYRIRIGDYRVRYEVHDDEATVLLLYCKHRKDVYRG